MANLTLPLKSVNVFPRFFQKKVYHPTTMPTTTSKLQILSSFGSTDMGLVRSRNEDNFLVDDDRHLYAVADGLGGVPNGDKASALAVDMIPDYYDEAVLRGDLIIKDMFSAINYSVYKEGHVLSPDLGMATTLTLAQVIGNSLAIGHVGDSAAYLYRTGTVRQLTAEHTLRAAVMARTPECEHANIPEALGHTLTRCIGHRPTIDVDIVELPLEAGDRVMLCSDGINKYVDIEFIEKAFAVATSAEALARMLVSEARNRGGMDNATAVAFFVTGPTPRMFGLSQPHTR
jgi:PPM family protein phosphatase